MPFLTGACYVLLFNKLGLLSCRGYELMSTSKFRLIACRSIAPPGFVITGLPCICTISRLLNLESSVCRFTHLLLLVLLLILLWHNNLLFFKVKKGFV